MSRKQFGFQHILALAFAGLLTAESNAARIGPTQSELDQSASSKDSWLMTNKSYDGQRYVALDQINATNVGGLKEVCT